MHYLTNVGNNVRCCHTTQEVYSKHRSGPSGAEKWKAERPANFRLELHSTLLYRVSVCVDYLVLVHQ